LRILLLKKIYKDIVSARVLLIGARVFEYFRSKRIKVHNGKI
jgi:hypothetical protein